MSKKKFILAAICCWLLAKPIALAQGQMPYGNPAKNLIKQFETMEQEYNLQEKNDNCEKKAGIFARSQLRLELGSWHFFEEAGDIFRNACLRKDLDLIEMKMGKVINQIPVSSSACDEATSTQMKNDVKLLQAKISCLRQYGEDYCDSKDKKCQEKMALNCAGNKVLTYTDKTYTDQYCPDPGFFKIFEKLANSWRNLKISYQAFKKGISWNSLKLSARDNLLARENAKQKATAWMQKNFYDQFSGLQVDLSIDWYEKTKKGLAEKIKEEKDTAKGKLSKAQVDTSGLISNVFNEYNTALQDYEFAKKLTDFFVEMNINKQMDVELAWEISKTIDCYIISLAQTTDIENDIQDKMPNNKEIMSSCSDNFIGENIPDGLKQKKEGLKKLLDTHCPNHNCY